MNKLERPDKPEIKTKELLNLLDIIKYENGQEFEYNGSSYYLILINTEDLAADPNPEDVFFSRSTLINGWDIYLLETLTPDRKFGKMFHEILECNLIDQGYQQKAHILARAEETRVFGER